MIPQANDYWDRVLQAVIAVVILYALGLVAVGPAIGDHVFDRFGFGPASGSVTSDEGHRYLRLIYAILGSVIVGWMLTIAALASGPLRRRERWAWDAITSGLVVWFVLDSGVSLRIGFESHAVFNLAFTTALAVPLIAMKKQLHPRSMTTRGRHV